MRKVLKIDEQGFYLEDVLLQDEEETPLDCIEIQPPEGLFKLRWLEGSWVEGSTPSELEAVQKKMDAYLTEIQAKIDAELRRTRQFDAMLTATQKLIRVDDLTVEELASIIDLYPDWTAGKAYKIGDVVQYMDKLYKVIQAHTSQADWTPDLVPALFLNKMPDNIIPVWIQPTGAHDAYALGARVLCEGKVYESLIAANVWKPVGNPSLWKEVV